MNNRPLVCEWKRRGAGEVEQEQQHVAASGEEKELSMSLQQVARWQLANPQPSPSLLAHLHRLLFALTLAMLELHALLVCLRESAVIVARWQKVCRTLCCGRRRR